MSATTNLGKVSVTPKGAWAITNAYEILDIVASGGSSYLAKQDVPTGVSLSNTSYWIMIAEKGDGGEVTSASASISGGYGTPGVTVTAGGTAHERTLAFAFTNLRGEKGETGNGIDSVYKTGTSGLVDTYTILFTDGSTYEFEVNNGTASIDDTLTKSGWAADAKAVGDTKASIDGFYETMGVGVADNLTPYSEDSGASQDIPFIAQGTGCGNGESVVDTGSYCQLKKKLGNTVCVNQLCDIADGTHTGAGNETNTNLFDFSLNKYYLFMAKVTFPTQPSSGGGSPSPAAPVMLGFWKGSDLRRFTFSYSPTGYYLGVAQGSALQGALGDANGATITLQMFPNTGETVTYSSVKVIDLTLWFGGNDRIPSDLLAHPENWGRYYAGSLAYNAGTLESADGTVLKSIGRNFWDEEWELGTINTTTGAEETSTNRIRSKNYIPVSPNTECYVYGVDVGAATGRACFYDANKNFVGGMSDFPVSAGNKKFTTPANAHFMLFSPPTSYGTTYGQNITLSRFYTGESGYSEYYPYSVLAEVDTGSEVLRGVEGSRDEKLPSGEIKRNRARIDMSLLNWDGSSPSNHIFRSSTLVGIAQGPSSGYIPSTIICARYTVMAWSPLSANDDMNIAMSGAGNITLIDHRYSDLESFLASLPGIYLEYPLATPTTEQGTAFAENIPCDDFGSMYWTQTKGIPQGNEIFYPVDYKASIDTLYNRVEGDMGAIVIDSQLEVVADRIPEAPSEDGTYTLKATVSSGTKTYSWVADE